MITDSGHERKVFSVVQMMHERRRPRPETREILHELGRGRPVLVKGPRGSGKVSLMMQAAFAFLEDCGSARAKVGFLDLEEARFHPLPSLTELDKALDRLGEISVLVLNGLDRINQDPAAFCRWIGDLQSSRNMIVLSSISGRATMDRMLEESLEEAEIGVVLCLPVGFGQWMDFRTDTSVNNTTIDALLSRYLIQGGMEVQEDESKRSSALSGLFFNTLMNDVILRCPVRDVEVLTNIAVNLISATGRPASASRLKASMTRSVDQARMYLDHLESSGLIYLVPRLEDAGRSASRASRLCFATDTGLAAALNPSEILDLEGIALTAVFLELLRRGFVPAQIRGRRSKRAGVRGQIWAFRSGAKHGLIVMEDDKESLLLGVCNSEDPDIRWMKRAMKSAGIANALILLFSDHAVTDHDKGLRPQDTQDTSQDPGLRPQDTTSQDPGLRPQDTTQDPTRGLTLRPLSQWLLGDGSFPLKGGLGVEDDLITDITVKKRETEAPSKRPAREEIPIHLL